MAGVAPSRTKINTEVTQLASRQPSRRSPGWVQLGRPARRPARVGGDARGSVRDPGRQVVELDCGITVYPPETEGEPWRAVFTENGQRRYRQAATEARLAAKLEKVKERLQADAGGYDGTVLAVFTAVVPCVHDADWLELLIGRWVAAPPGQFGLFAEPCGLGLEVTGFLPLGLILAGRRDRGPGLFWVHEGRRSTVLVEAARRRQRPGAGTWEVDDRRIAFNRVQLQGPARAISEQERAFGQVLQERRLDRVLVDTLSCRGVTPVGPASL